MRKSVQKIINSFVILVMLGGFFAAIMPRPALAQTQWLNTACSISDNEKEGAVKKAIHINFPMPGVTKKLYNPQTGETNYAVKDLPCFVAGLYMYLAGVAGILATVMIMYGGIKYVTSFGSQSRITEAKDTIYTSLVGLILTLASFVILNFINPNIVALKLPGITIIEEQPEEGTYEITRLCDGTNLSDRSTTNDYVSCGNWKYLETNSSTGLKEFCLGIYCDSTFWGTPRFCQVSNEKSFNNKIPVYTKGDCLDTIIGFNVEKPEKKYTFHTPMKYELTAWMSCGTTGYAYKVGTDCPANKFCVVRGKVPLAVKFSIVGEWLEGVYPDGVAQNMLCE